MLIQLLLVIGLALPIATLSVFYYDVHHALPIALTTLFYLSPVFYPASMVPEAARAALLPQPHRRTAHPLPRRRCTRGGCPRSASSAACCSAAVVIYLVGYAIFRRYAAIFPEIV